MAAAKSKKRGEVTFVSPQYPDLTVVRRPQRTLKDEKGNQIVQKGIRSQFSNGTLITSDTQEIKYLRENDLFENGQIFELKGQKDAPPASESALKDVQSAAAAGDSLELQRILQAEEQSHNRSDVVAAARVGLTVLGIDSRETAVSRETADRPKNVPNEPSYEREDAAGDDIRQAEAGESEEQVPQTNTDDTSHPHPNVPPEQRRETEPVAVSNPTRRQRKQIVAQKDEAENKAAGNKDADKAVAKAKKD